MARRDHPAWRSHASRVDADFSPRPDTACGIGLGTRCRAAVTIVTCDLTLNLVWFCPDSRAATAINDETSRKLPVSDPITLTQRQRPEFLLQVATVRPVMILGASGIGKTALVNEFAGMVGLPCVSLLGSQLAPEDLIGVPQILPNGRSRFCPPTLIARDDPYVLFLDELNASSPEVQKAFYSLIHERRVGEYCLPDGSVIVAAGNRAEDFPMDGPVLIITDTYCDHVRTRRDHAFLIPKGRSLPFSPHGPVFRIE